MKLEQILKATMLLILLFSTSSYAQKVNSVKEGRINYIQNDLSVTKEKAAAIANVLDKCWKHQRSVVMDTLLNSSQRIEKMKMISIERDIHLRSIVDEGQFQKIRSLSVRLRGVTDSIRKSLVIKNKSSKN